MGLGGPRRLVSSRCWQACAKLPPPWLSDSLVHPREECKKNARQNVLLGAPGRSPTLCRGISDSSGAFGGVERKRGGIRGDDLLRPADVRGRKCRGQRRPIWQREPWKSPPGATLS